MNKFLNFKKPMNLQEDDWNKFNTSSSINEDKIKIIYKKDIIISENGIMYENFKILKFSYPYPYHLFMENSRKSLKYIAKQIINYFKLKYYPQYVMNGNYLIITDFWSNNYFHWFSESLARLLNIQETSNQTFTILLPSSYKTNNFIIQSLELLDISYTFIEEKKNVFVRQVYIAPHLITSGHHIPEIMQRLRTKFFQKNKKNESEITRMYISRNKSFLRNIVNEKELSCILKKYNFKIVEMENYSWKKQVDMMTNVEYLIAPHGAGLTNMLFSQNKLSVLELLPQRKNKTINNCYYSLSSSLEYNYYYQFSEKQILSSRADDGGDSNFFINVNDFEKNIIMMLNHHAN